MPQQPSNRAAKEFDQAADWLRTDPNQRRIITRALVAALALHATVLVARMPDWGPDPVRVDAPAEQQMKVQFLKPPPPPPSEVTVPPSPAPAQQAGPIRVSPGQGPGLIKKVEPQYPPIARAARME